LKWSDLRYVFDIKEARSWTMKPLMAMDCIACAVMPTAAWLMPVAVQNRITRSCAVSGVVTFAMATPAASFWRTPPSRPPASARADEVT
jgi:hypothetical protein